MGFFRWLGRCCCPDCPPCPFPFQNQKGWAATPIPGCPQCPNCPPCPFPYASRTGWSTTFINECPRCPRCEDNPCYITGSPATACPCLPTRFSVSFAGVGITCACFCADSNCPTPPNQHFECSGNLTTQCFYAGHTDFVVPGEWPASYWGNDGPPDCGAPTTLTDFSTGVRYTGGAAFGVQVDILITAFGQLNGGGTVALFYGRYLGADCDGPWVIGNQAGSGGSCAYQTTPVFPNTNILVPGGGVAVVTACAC